VFEHCLKHAPRILRASSPWLSRETPKVPRSIAQPNLHWHTNTCLSCRPPLKFKAEGRSEARAKSSDNVLLCARRYAAIVNKFALAATGDERRQHRKKGDETVGSSAQGGLVSLIRGRNVRLSYLAVAE
jgi:hypothetical protein